MGGRSGNYRPYCRQPATARSSAKLSRGQPLGPGPAPSQLRGGETVTHLGAHVDLQVQQLTERCMMLIPTPYPSRQVCARPQSHRALLQQTSCETSVRRHTLQERWPDPLRGQARTGKHSTGCQNPSAPRAARPAAIEQADHDSATH